MLILSCVTSSLFTCNSVELFIPHIAVAFGHAPSFSHPRALSFSLNKLFEPNFGPGLSTKVLQTLTSNPHLNSSFDRFTSTSETGYPIDPVSLEIFDVDHYLPEIQFSYNISPSIEFAAKNFRTSDLYDALFPASVPTLKSFGMFIKKKILSKISRAIGGMFNAKVDIPTVGLTSNDVSLGGDGINIGMYTAGNNRLFPPVIDVDKVKVSLSEVIF